MPAKQRTRILVTRTGDQLILSFPGSDSFLRFLSCIVIGFAAYQGYVHADDLYDVFFGSSGDIWLLIGGAIGLGGLLYALFPLALFIGADHEILTIDPYSVTLRRVVFGRDWKNCVFLKSNIAALRYGRIGWSKYGEVYGVLFESDGKTTKFFRRLRTADATYLIQLLHSVGLTCRVDN